MVFGRNIALAQDLHFVDVGNCHAAFLFPGRLAFFLFIHPLNLFVVEIFGGFGHFAHGEESVGIAFFLEVFFASGEENLFVGELDGLLNGTVAFLNTA